MSAQDDSQLFLKPKDKDDWYTPQRDILRVWPSCIVRGAAYAVDPNGDIYPWLIKQDGHNAENAVAQMRKCLIETLQIIQDCRTASLEEVLSPDRVDYYTFKALMYGAGIVAFSTYNRAFREARLTEIKSGAVSEPTAPLDAERGVHMFDMLVKGVRE